MKGVYFQQSLREALRRRNFAYVMSSFLMVSNVLLGLKVWQQEEHWILIPQLESDQRFRVSSHQYSDAYVVAWADSVVRNMLTVNPQTVERRLAELLAIAQKSSVLEARFQKEARLIKQDQVSTVFYPKEHQIKGNQIWIKGTYQMWFGRDKAPVSSEKTYRVTWVKGPHNVILLADFEEESHEKR